jgi:hypothetical protein
MSRKRDGLALFGIWASYLVLARHFWFVSDDAYITFRYARNWAGGHGLRYNLGEHAPVEGFSNFLWVVVSAVFELLDWDPTLWVPLVSLGCGLALLTLLYRTLVAELDVSRAAAFLSTLTLSCFPPFAAWATGGLETMAFTLAVFLTFYFLILRREPAPVPAAIAGIAVCLLRTEGLAWNVVIVGLAIMTYWLDGRARSRVLRVVAIFVPIVAAGFLAFFLARYRYFGLWFPNPVYMKIHFGPAVLLRGFRYVATFFLTFLTPFLVVPAIIIAMRARWFPTLPIALMAIAFPMYAIVVGGDWMTMGRFLVPAFAFQAMLIALALSRLERRWPRSLRLSAAGTLVAIVVGALPGWNVHLVPESVLAHFRFMYFNPGFKTEYDRWAAQNVKPERAREVGLALKRISKPGDSIVVGAIGSLGYYSELFIYDRFGLVTREVALNPRAADEPLRAPGHDGKVSRTFFLEEHPTFVTHTVIEGSELRRWVLDQAAAWKKLHRSTLWRRYVPDFVEIQGRPDSEARELVMVLRAIEEPPDDPILELARRERRRRRNERAERLWEAFYERARTLPDSESAISSRR